MRYSLVSASLNFWLASLEIGSMIPCNSVILGWDIRIYRRVETFQCGMVSSSEMSLLLFEAVVVKPSCSMSHCFCVA
jgi:hypothetical protein